MHNRHKKPYAVVVTRPETSAAALIEALQQQGIFTIHWPAMRIQATPDRPWSTLKTPAWLIFTSQHAVAYGLRQNPPLHAFKIAAIGQATAAKIREKGIIPDLVADYPHSSEALLSHSSFQRPLGERIYLLKGLGGRRLLAKTLRERGAIVEEIAVYRRELAKTNITLEDWRHYSAKYQLIIAAMSNESLRFFCQLLPDALRQELLQTPVCLINQRHRRYARQLGFSNAIILAGFASSQAISQAIINYVRQ